MSRRCVEVEQPATLKNEFSFLEVFKQRQDSHLSEMLYWGLLGVCDNPEFFVSIIINEAMV